MENKTLPAPLHQVVGRIYQCPECSSNDICSMNICGTDLRDNYCRKCHCMWTESKDGAKDIFKWGNPPNPEVSGPPSGGSTAPRC